jgi:DNA-binding MarR family transcriptional regulator
VAPSKTRRVEVDQSINDDGLALFVKFATSFHRISHALDAQLTQQLQLPLVWYTALQQLGLAPNTELTLSDLSAQCGLSLAGGSRLAVRLEDAGYVKRVQSGEDRRVWFVQLRDDGCRVLNSAITICAKLIDAEMVEPLSSSERWLLERALTTLATDERRPKNPTVEAIRARRGASHELDKDSVPVNLS